MNQNAPKSENCNNYMYVAIFYNFNGVYIFSRSLYLYYQNVELNNLNTQKYHHWYNQ